MKKNLLFTIFLLIGGTIFLFSSQIGKDLITLKADIVTITQPQSSHGYRFIPINFSQSAAVSPGSLEMVFLQVPLGTDYHIFINEAYANPLVGSIDATNILASPFVSPSSSASIPDDYYNVTIRWKRASDSGNESLALSAVIIDTTTLPGIIDEPQTGGSYTTALPISIYLPDPPTPGSVRVVFHNNNTGANTTLGIIDNPPGTFFFINPRNIVVASPVTSTSATSMEGGNYNMTLSYQDDFGNPTSSVTESNFTIVGAAVSPPPVTPPAGSTPTPVPTPTTVPVAEVLTTDANGNLVSMPVTNADGTPITNVIVSKPSASQSSLLAMIALCCGALAILLGLVGYLVYQNPKVRAWFSKISK